MGLLEPAGRRCRFHGRTDLSSTMHLKKREFIKRLVTYGLYTMIPSEKPARTNPKGVIIRQSPFSVHETIDRLESLVRQRDGSLYARIDQQAELHKAGLTSRPLEFILFGNPKGGGPVIVENPVAALDLPLKIIAWEDEHNKVWVAYNSVTYIGERYKFSAEVVSRLRLNGLVTEALNLE